MNGMNNGNGSKASLFWLGLVALALAAVLAVLMIRGW